MKKRNLGLALAMGASAIILAALPGHSAKLKSADDCAKEIVQANERALAAQAQQVSRHIADQEKAWQNVQEIQRIEAPEMDDVEVFIGSGSWLGVETNEVTAKKAKELKLPAECGVLVGKIVPDSPAAKAGLKERDVITELNGQKIEGTAQFRRMIREIPAGRVAQLTILRDGRSQNISVTLGKQELPRVNGVMRIPSPGTFNVRVPDMEELPEFVEMDNLDSFGVIGMPHPRLGIDAEDVQGELGTYFGAPNGEGVLVRSVFSESPAAKAGLKAGDVITSVNGKPVRHVRDLRSELKGASEEKSLKIGLLRNKSDMTVDVQIPPRVKKEILQRGERTNL